MRDMAACGMGPSVPPGFPCVTTRNTDGAANQSQEPTAQGPALEVFWRPGCPYCSRLRRELSRRHVPATWRNIWDDPAARDIVRWLNSGNETVPTARIGATDLTNPSWSQLAPLLGDGPCSIAAPQPDGGRLRTMASWSPVVLFVIISLALTLFGNNSLAWGADALAVAAWWLTRPLRA